MQLDQIPQYHFAGSAIVKEARGVQNMPSQSFDPPQDQSRFIKIETQVEYIEKSLAKSIENITYEIRSLHTKIDGFNDKFDKVNTKISDINKTLTDKISETNKTLTEKIDSNFKWLIGTIITLFVTGTAGTIITILLKAPK